MTVRGKAREALHRVQLVVDSWRSFDKPALVIYGNCQAEALRVILAGTPSVTERYTVTRIPAAHLITPDQIGQIRRIIGRSAVFVTQRVRDGYRDLPLGSSQLASDLNGRTITFPVMYYRGLHPYLVYVHADGELGTQAPLTGGYHDLRIVAAAAQNLGGQEAVSFVHRWRGNPDHLAKVSQGSLDILRSREEGLDIRVAHLIEKYKDRSFWTLNHPSNSLLTSVAEQAMAHLGIDAAPVVPERELLDDVVVPPSADVVPDHSSGDRWRLSGREVALGDIVAAHLHFYRRRGDVLRTALREHSDALRDSGLSSTG